jgi:feruloyl esterase
VKNIYGVPVNSRGVVLSTRGVLPGSELSWEQSFAHVWGESYFEDMQLLSPPGTPWNYRDFNFDTDVKRSGVGVLFPSANPDLREFDRAGGKLITYQGTNDTAEIPGAVFDYYETVQHTLGGRRITEEFYRHFAVPAMDHCTGGDGAFSVDYLSYMERWVEEGHPPEVMIGVHIDGLQKSEGFVLNAKPDPDATVRFTRPLYPYPQYARYSGHGDPNKAENFEPVTGSTGVLRDIENR